MVERIQRFKLCDLRFHPHLVKVIERLPEEVRKKVLNDRSFQILTDEDVVNASVLRYKFSDPVKSLVYLNTNILKEPKPQIIHIIASEIARYILSNSEFDFGEKEHMPKAKEPRINIDPDNWKEFLQSFSIRNVGRRARFEVFRSNGKVEEEEQESHLEDVRLKDAGDSTSIEILRIDRREKKTEKVRDEITALNLIIDDLDHTWLGDLC